MPRQNAKLEFPFGGIVEVTSYAEQPPGSTFDVLNVRPHDSLKARRRGGQRAGLERYITTAVNGVNPIQRIGSVVIAFDSSTIVADTSLLLKDFTAMPDGILTTADPSGTDWTLYQARFTAAATSTGEAAILSSALRGSPDPPSIVSSEALVTASITPGTKYIIKWTGAYEGSGAFPNSGISFRVDLADPVGSRATPGHFQVRIAATSGGTAHLVRILNTVTTLPTPDTGSTDISGLVSDITASNDFELHVSGNAFRLLVNNVEAWTHTDSTHSGQAGIAIGLDRDQTAGSRNSVTSFQILTGITPASLRSTKLVVVSGGSIFDGDKANGLAASSGGTSAETNTGTIGFQDAFQKAYFADGLSSGYNVLDPKTRIVTAWQAAVTAGALPTGGTGVANAVTAVNTTTPSFTVAEDLSSLSAGDFIEIRDSTGNDQSYEVVSDSGTGPTVITVQGPIPDSTADGDLYVSDKGCRFMALYRGRIVASGLETDPQNWYMSRSGDPNDWDYYPVTPDGLEAVAGNANQAGKLEDIVTALVPYLDDVLYFGGDHTIWVLSGDAAENGRIDNVSRQIGIVGPDAHTFDTTATLYIMGQNGLYRLQAGTTTLASVSVGRLDDTLAQLDFAANEVRLMYDREWQGVHLFITPTSEPAASTDHYFWDERTDSFWRDQYPTAHGPTAVFLFDADAFDDRAVILGGFDSVLRFFDRTKKTDDGTTIHSYVRFTPLVAGDRGKVRLSETTINLAEGSDSSAVLQIFAANTAEQAAAETVPKAARTLSEGRNRPLVQRVSANTIIVSIDNNTSNTTWAYENGSVVVESAGIVRREETS